MRGQDQCERVTDLPVPSHQTVIQQTLLPTGTKNILSITKTLRNIVDHLYDYPSSKDSISSIILI